MSMGLYCVRVAGLHLSGWQNHQKELSRMHGLGAPETCGRNPERPGAPELTCAVHAPCECVFLLYFLNAG